MVYLCRYIVVHIIGEMEILIESGKLYESIHYQNKWIISGESIAV